jgi:RHS repeat-associated protein
VNTSATYWLHCDHLQSVRAVTNSAGGSVVKSRYRPYGEQLDLMAPTIPEAKGYIGQRHDDETGLLYLHARYYDPVLGRFIQADPSNPTGQGVGVNRYAYALNSPTMAIDPLGLFAQGPGQGNRETKTAGGGNIGNSQNSGSANGVGADGGRNSERGAAAFGVLARGACNCRMAGRNGAVPALTSAEIAALEGYAAANHSRPLGYHDIANVSNELGRIAGFLAGQLAAGARFVSTSSGAALAVPVDLAQESSPVLSTKPQTFAPGQLGSLVPFMTDALQGIYGVRMSIKNVSSTTAYIDAEVAGIVTIAGANFHDMLEVQRVLGPGEIELKSFPNTFEGPATIAGVGLNRPSSEASVEVKIEAVVDLSM